MTIKKERKRNNGEKRPGEDMKAFFVPDRKAKLMLMFVGQAADTPGLSIAGTCCLTLQYQSSKGEKMLHHHKFYFLIALWFTLLGLVIYRFCSSNTQLKNPNATLAIQITQGDIKYKRDVKIKQLVA